MRKAVVVPLVRLARGVSCLVAAAGCLLSPAAEAAPASSHHPALIRAVFQRLGVREGPCVARPASGWVCGYTARGASEFAAAFAGAADLAARERGYELKSSRSGQRDGARWWGFTLRATGGAGSGRPEVWTVYLTGLFEGRPGALVEVAYSGPPAG